MKADEARLIATGEHKKRMDLIYKEIRKEAEKQSYKMFWYKELYSAEIEELKSNGFAVETVLDRNENFYRIDWSYQTKRESSTIK